jgi:hypothetical protein
MRLSSNQNVQLITITLHMRDTLLTFDAPHLASFEESKRSMSTANGKSALRWRLPMILTRVSTVAHVLMCDKPNL